MFVTIYGIVATCFSAWGVWYLYGDSLKQPDNDVAFVCAAYTMLVGLFFSWGPAMMSIGSGDIYS